jgi:hypothetical protein
MFVIKRGEEESVVPYAYLIELYNHVRKNK